MRGRGDGCVASPPVESPDPHSDRPLLVLRLIARMNMGGPAHHVSILSTELPAARYRTLLVTGRVGAGEQELPTDAQPLRLDHLGPELKPWPDFLTLCQLVRLMRRHRPDIVHTHTAKAGAVGRLAALLAGEPRPLIVHTFHGHVLRGYFGPLRATAFRLLERSLARVSTALVAVSPQVRDDLVALGVAPPERFAVLRLGIELEQRVAANGAVRDDARRLLGLPPERFVVGWIGRMTGVKRTDDVLLALRGLRERGIDASLCMVGDGPDREHVE